MRIVSWNVNGLRSVLKKDFLAWLDEEPADIIGLQETRATREQLPSSVQQHQRYSLHLRPADKLGYSGVAVMSKHEPDEVHTSLGRPEFDVEGRFVEARFGKLTIASVYFPNGNGKNRDNSRIPYKLDFTKAVFDHFDERMRAGERIFIMGDTNTAHCAIDLARPKQNIKTSGFTPKEREAFGALLDRGWIDTFRAKHPDEEGHYSWWSLRSGARARNVGWRIDYVIASPGAWPFVQSAFIDAHVTGSDHCPVGVEVDPSICD